LNEARRRKFRKGQPYRLARCGCKNTPLYCGATRPVTLEPDTLHAVTHRDQRHHQSDSGEQGYGTEFIAKKFRGFLQSGDHSDGGGHGILILLLFLPKQARTDFLITRLVVLLCEFVHTANQRGLVHDERHRQSASIIVATVLTMFTSTAAMFPV
jgi:hypothetical protein